MSEFFLGLQVSVYIQSSLTSYKTVTPGDLDSYFLKKVISKFLRKLKELLASFLVKYL